MLQATPSPARKFTRSFLRRKLDWSAAAGRLEVILDFLTNYGVAQTVKIDRAAARRAIDYCRWRAAGGKDPPGEEDFMCDAECEMMEFLRAHNQSMSWVLSGDPTEMITALAEGTCSQTRPQLRIV